MTDIQASAPARMQCVPKSRRRRAKPIGEPAAGAG
jgi:hypothetical protein